MSTTLSFRSEEALQVALTAGLIPAEAEARPARVERAVDGSLRIATDVPLSAAVRRSLAQAGIAVAAPRRWPSPRRADVGMGENQVPVFCWAEALPARRTREPAAVTGTSGTVLFVAGQAEPVIDLAAELLRLGCERQQACFLDDEQGHPLALLRASDPPYYSVTRALDGERGLAAYAPVRGRDGVWLELGWTHPLRDRLRVEGGLLLVAGGRPWRVVADGPWLDLRQVLDLEVPAAEGWRAGPLPARRRVPLRLARAARGEPASLWVLRSGGGAAQQAQQVIDRLVGELPEEVIARLQFAVGAGADAPVVLRARAGRQGPPALTLAAEAYAPLLGVPGLYAPVDALVEPPLRRERLRELLAAPDCVTWLAPLARDSDGDGARGPFRPERLPESAFAPLADWVDYVVNADAELLAPWVRNAIFDLPEFTTMPHEERASAPPRKAPRAARTEAQAGPERAPSPVTAPPSPSRQAGRTGAAAQVAARPDGVLEEELAALQRSFLASDAPADAPERSEDWRVMAELNHALGRGREAALAWARAVWELPPDSEAAAIVLGRWVDAEALRHGGAASLLALATVTSEQVSALAAEAAASCQRPLASATAVHRFLDRHEGVLDVRTRWLARTALARLAGGDRLALARARDGVLAALAGGLSLERDVPAFLRFAGGGHGVESGAASRLVAQLEHMLEHYDRTRRTRSPVEAQPVLTRAYVLATAAVAFARLGATERAHALRDQAAAAVDRTDPVHGFLMQAYAARVAQALQGLPATAPLPPEITARLNGLDRFARYKVDRLRQASALLEPQEGRRLDPAAAFSRGERDLRGEEFAQLRALTDRAALDHQLEALLARALAPATSADERGRLFDGVLDFLPRVGEAPALAALERIVPSCRDLPPATRALLLEEALAVAGHYGRPEVASRLLRELHGVLTALPAPAEAAPGLAGALRSLRRVGLLDAAQELLHALDARLAGSPVLARLPVAAGYASLGHLDRARPILAEARQVLAGAPAMPQRLELLRALAITLGHTPINEALPALAELSKLLAGITDSFNTNSHYCFSVVHAMESLLGGLASADLALGELGRRFLEDDELLVRRRLHRDLGEL
jgi:hypothetical protein